MSIFKKERLDRWKSVSVCVYEVLHAEGAAYKNWRMGYN